MSWWWFFVFVGVKIGLTQHFLPIFRKLHQIKWTTCVFYPPKNTQSEHRQKRLLNSSNTNKKKNTMYSRLCIHDHLLSKLWSELNFPFVCHSILCIFFLLSIWHRLQFMLCQKLWKFKWGKMDTQVDTIKLIFDAFLPVIIQFSFIRCNLYRLRKTYYSDCIYLFLLIRLLVESFNIRCKVKVWIGL